MSAPPLCQLQLNLPAHLGFLALVSESLRAVLEQAPDLPEKESLLYGVQLAVQETCTNIIHHAYGDSAIADGRLALEIRLAADRLEVQLEDSGAPFTLPDPATLQPPTEPQEHGYGLFLIYSLVDEVVYRPAPGRNRWVLIKHLPPPAG